MGLWIWVSRNIQINKVSTLFVRSPSSIDIGQRRCPGSPTIHWAHPGFSGNHKSITDTHCLSVCSGDYIGQAKSEWIYLMWFFCSRILWETRISWIKNPPPDYVHCSNFNENGLKLFDMANHKKNSLLYLQVYFVAVSGDQRSAFEYSH